MTVHRGGGLGAAISSYILESRFEHTVLELEESLRPNDDLGSKVITYDSSSELLEIAKRYDIVLVHYYAHPLTSRAIFRLSQLPLDVKVVAWCHNNGLTDRQPLPQRLNDLVDLVILSGCEHKYFKGAEIIRPLPKLKNYSTLLEQLTSSSQPEPLSFRYIGSLDESKICTSASEWFDYLQSKGSFSVYTLDGAAKFSRFQTFRGITDRKVLYDRRFCALYPLRGNHYGCGELAIQELLMLGFPVVLKRNKVELDITQNLSGVMFFHSLDALIAIYSNLMLAWPDLVASWRTRAVVNCDVIKKRKPYQTLDDSLEKVRSKMSVRESIDISYDAKDLLKFAYDANDDETLKSRLCSWAEVGSASSPHKGSPSQFVAYFPELAPIIRFYTK